MAEIALGVFRASDGVELYDRRVVPAEPCRGRIVVLHGIRSHGGWYERSVRAFAEAGYEVRLLDRRGSGRNTAYRGDTPNASRCTADVVDYLLHLRQTRSALPTYLIGISWGGKLALSVAAAKPGLVQGVALVCPGLVPVIQPPFIQRMRIALARFLRPNKRFAIPLNGPELFTGSPEWQRWIADDPLGLTEATARFLFCSAVLDRRLKRVAHRVTCPLLMLLAGKDRILDNPGTRRYLARFANAATIAVREYPEAQHTLEFEERQPFVGDVLSWMKRSGGMQ